MYVYKVNNFKYSDNPYAEIAFALEIVDTNSSR